MVIAFPGRRLRVLVFIVELTFCGSDDSLILSEPDASEHGYLCHCTTLCAANIYFFKSLPPPIC